MIKMCENIPVDVRIKIYDQILKHFIEAHTYPNGQCKICNKIIEGDVSVAINHIYDHLDTTDKPQTMKSEWKCIVNNNYCPYLDKATNIENACTYNGSIMGCNHDCCPILLKGTEKKIDYIGIIKKKREPIPTKDMRIYEAQDIIKTVGMTDSEPEPHTMFSTIGFCEGATTCNFCGNVIHYNALKQTPIYCYDCIGHARSMITNKEHGGIENHS